MSPFTIGVGAFLIALVVMSFTFLGVGVLFAVPVAAIGIAILGVLDVRRRRNKAKTVEEFRDEAKAEKVDFTERDKETLASSD